MANSVMEFHFKNEDKIFLAGKFVQGTLQVAVKPDTRIDSIDLVLRGVLCANPFIGECGKSAKTTPAKENKKSRQSMKSENGSFKNSPNVGQVEMCNYRIEKLFYELTTVLYNSSSIIPVPINVLSKGAGKESSVGYEYFKFSLALPNNLPSSVEDAKFYLRYYLSAFLKESNSTNGVVAIYKIKSELSINSVFDINRNEKAIEPKTVSYKDDALCCCLPSLDSMSADFHIDRRAFVPGEEIKFSGIVSNNSATPILYVRVSLMQKALLRVSDFYSFKRRVAFAMKGSILSFDRQLWQQQSIHIPALPCSSDTSTMILKYRVQMEIVRSGQNGTEGKCTVLKIPIVIGNVPHVSLVNIYNEGLSNYDILFHGPYYPMPVSDLCDLAVKSGCSFIPKYLKYTLKDATHNDEEILEIPS